MRQSHYILDGHQPVPVATYEGRELIMDAFIRWATWFETADRIVQQTQIDTDEMVSTVFLGLDHATSGPPCLFETMVFGGKFDQHQERYATWEEAEEGHRRVVEMVMRQTEV
jgi:hypothetical protein